MKTAGIVGGIGPESTVDYYRTIVALYRARRDGESPSLVINSIDLERLLKQVAAKQFAELGAYLLEAIHRLAAAGANFAVLASNTPHVIFPDLAARSPIPLISIVDVARDAAERLKLRRLGILGTRFTMQGTFYAEVFKRSAIAVVPPPPQESGRVHDIYMEELVNGIVRDESRRELLRIVAAMRADESLDGVLLAGTELPLLLRGHEPAGIAFLDTAQLHCARVVDELVSR